MDTNVKTGGLAPFSLKDAPALIERVFPAQKIGIESQKERKAVQGQTLTALGSYWKGRKPLVLVRATVLASLLPATDDPGADLEVFEALMVMDKLAMTRRNPKVTASMVWRCSNVLAELKTEHLTPAERDEEGDADERHLAGTDANWRRQDLAHLPFGARRIEKERIEEERAEMRAVTFRSLTFAEQVGVCERVEKMEDLRNNADPLYVGIWERVNSHLNTCSRSLPELIQQLGVARFGQLPVVGDPFCGGGSIPFEAARIGCDVVASDLNPVAAMLTWGALNIIGADADERSKIADEQKRIAREVEAEITKLGIEHSRDGDRAKTYLYCLETVDPQTGWLVPMSPSWVVSRSRRCVAKLVPDYARKRFDIVMQEAATAADIRAAEIGTVRDGYLVYSLAPIEGGETREWRIAVSRLRGDGEGPMHPDGSRGNRLRQWDVRDFEPLRPWWNGNSPPVVSGAAPGAWLGGDVWQERLYCIQWMDGADVSSSRPRPSTRFAGIDSEDIERERNVATIVSNNLTGWQQRGLVPDIRIEPGDKTDEPIRTRGWTYWHHLFSARHLLFGSRIPSFFPEAV